MAKEKKALLSRKKKNTTAQPEATNQEAWKILIADDEPEVHDATKLALHKLKFKGQELIFLSAYSGKEAKQLLKEHPDIALILLDVVMEEVDTGLQLIRIVRDELKNKLVRIILCTDQPEQAPEKEVILDYDINDYKLKAELTAQRLFVTVVTALRSYYDLSLIETSRKEWQATCSNLQQEMVEHKQAKETLIETEKRTQLIIDTVLDAVVSMDAKGIITGWNAQAEVVFGWSKSEAVGQTVASLIIPHQYHKAHRKGVARVLATGHGPVLNQRIEITALHRDGHEFPIELSITSVKSENTYTFSAFIRDISTPQIKEQKIQELLNYQAQQVKISTEIAQELAIAPAMEDLFQRVVNLMQDRFGYYHVHIYMLENKQLIMKEGAGETGRQMKEAGYKIALTSKKSLMAQAARSGKVVLIHDVEQEPDWLPNKLLPHTKSEIAVPIKLADTVIGVLDVQADTVNGLGEEDQLLLLGLCGQIAIAMNSRQAEGLLYKRVEELNCINDIGRKIAETPPIPALLTWITQRIPAAMQHPNLCKVAVTYEGEVYGHPDAVELSTQIVHALRIRDKVVGRIYIAYTEKQNFLDDESALLGSTANRISSYIESRFLFEQNEHRVEQEQRVRLATDKIRQGASREAILKIAQQEISQILGVSNSVVQLGTREQLLVELAQELKQNKSNDR